MKNTARKVAIFTYTMILLIGAVLLFAFTIYSKNHTTINNAANRNMEETILPSGTKYKKIEYGQSFSIYDLFSIAPDDRLNLTINTSNYSVQKIGTTDINVTFEKNNSISTGLIRLTVVDTKKPIIKMPDLSINENDSFDKLAGVTAEDNVDKDLTQKIVVNGTVDSSVPGQYKLSYEVTDSSGNLTRSDRNVNVIKTFEERNNQQATPAASITEESVSNSSTAEAPQQQAPAISNETTNNSEPTSTPLVADSLIIAGVAVPYQNGGQGAGQSIIDGDSYGTASTWGGAPVQSGSDGMNTHFIGHNPGIFSILFSAGIGSPIIVTDSTGQATTYVVNNILRVDDYGNDLSTKVNYWDLTIGTGGGERITLQTCITDAENLIVLASK
ncbi:immunoglobulin-like domain-containing protein [Enterococcus rivorum]|uniref:Pesticidal crystal protein Cry22Aa Ig-like domain-containing protein n=1 Tax=Enterococcus rivorum TaxID=762845 RepID=A0A1E5KTS0_9ENTE|nr:immunoglobulin-like domain-containing protein [Enterococcus rivorum]MBP2097887.1 hypothetical protein [Enterococcus rivorum]OEH81260.1 hypothetical protein BCR26_05265 [Enterococcus rivorum]